MPEIAVDIELYCDTCGSGICGNGTATYRRNQPSFRIAACDKCVAVADEVGYTRGYAEGFDEARKRYDKD